MVTSPSQQRGFGRSILGHPLTKFHHLVELFGGFQDAVQGHKDLYDRDILHRNIGHNNILLTGDPMPGQRALIVYLDNSINMEDLAFYDDERRGTPAFMSYEALTGEPHFQDAEPHIPLTPLSSLHFGVAAEEATSAMLKPSPRKRILHDAVHDLESFFWVFCWLCMTHEGPGTKREFKPEGLTPEAVIKARHAQVAIFKMFENRFTPSERKNAFMINSARFQENIIASFTPYFKPAKEVALYLYSVLQKAYRERNFSGLHDTFIQVFKLAAETPEFKDWHIKKSDYESMEEAVRKGREREEDVSNSPKPERAGVMEKVSRATGTKRSRPKDEFEAIQEKSEDDEAPASSLSSNSQGRKKRAKTASSSRVPADIEAVAGTAVQSNSSSQRAAGRRKRCKTYSKRNNRR